MFLDTRTRSITFRVLYAGPEAASKFLSLRMMQEQGGRARRREISVYHTEGERLLALDLDPERDLDLMGCRVAFQLLALPGGTPSAAAFRLLMRAADAVVFLPDRGDPAGEATRRALAELFQELRRLGRSPQHFPLVVQGYRDDPHMEELLEVPVPPGWSRPELLMVSGDSAGEVRRVFDVARRAVIGHYREFERGWSRGNTWRRVQEHLGTRPRGRRLSRRTAVLGFACAAAAAGTVLAAYLLTSAL